MIYISVFLIMDFSLICSRRRCTRHSSCTLFLLHSLEHRLKVSSNFSNLSQVKLKTQVLNVSVATLFFVFSTLFYIIGWIFIRVRRWKYVLRGNLYVAVYVKTLNDSKPHHSWLGFFQIVLCMLSNSCTNILQCMLVSVLSKDFFFFCVFSHVYCNYCIFQLWSLH